MTTPIISSLTRYPIKSAAGIDVSEARLDDFGLWMDRRWMLIDPTGRFITQRQLPRLALLQTALAEDGTLQLRYGDHEPLTVPIPGPGAPTCEAEVWGDRCEARLANVAHHQWLRDALGVACRLAFMPESTRRPVTTSSSTYVDLSDDGARVSFSDGYPLLLISEASLEDLNRRLDAPVPMNRFRPNIVVRGCAPYAEDDWRRIRVGELEFDVVKPCSRCSITTTDQADATRGAEPLRTLATYRKVGQKVMFGQNMIHRGAGVVRVGDAIEVLRRA